MAVSTVGLAPRARRGRRRRCVGDRWLLPLAVGLALDDEFVGGALEAVDRGLGEQRVGHLGEELIWNWHTFDLTETGCEQGIPR